MGIIIEWDESYRVGIATYDNQHKKLFLLLDKLFLSLKEKNGKEIMGDVLEELTQYTITHFAEEESDMVKLGYPAYQEHKAEHDALAENVKALLASYRAGTTPLTVEVLGFINEWLKNHIPQTDKKYGPFLSDKGIK